MKIIEFIISLLWVLVIYIVVASLWVAIEKVIYGEVTPRQIDTIVAIILAISLYANIKK
jgi:hypothetical protein